MKMASPATVSHCHHSPATAGDVSSTSQRIYVAKCHAVTVLGCHHGRGAEYHHEEAGEYQLGGLGSADTKHFS